MKRWYPWVGRSTLEVSGGIGSMIQSFADWPMNLISLH